MGEVGGGGLGSRLGSGPGLGSGLGPGLDSGLGSEWGLGSKLERGRGRGLGLELFGRHERERPLDGIVESKGVEPRRPLGALRRGHRGRTGARRVDDPQQLLREIA